MAQFDGNEHPHRRYNPLFDEWVLVSPHRMKRPWSGQVDPPEEDNIPDYDPTNPLCPGNTRSNGEVNPDYKTTFVFPNDFAALLKETPQPEQDECDLFRLEAVTGECKVMCFHPKTNKTIARMEVDELLPVIETWVDVSNQLSQYKWVQIFENRGKMMGCSNPHPHGQVWATSFLPNLPEKADTTQRNYYQKTGKRMLEVYAAEEAKRGERTVYENQHWLVVVPYWATWPYQVMLLPKFTTKKMSDFSPEQRKSFARALIALTVKYDNLFKCNFPYSMGFYQSPNGIDDDHWTFHAHFFPPLLRSASIRKFMVGFEMAAMPQRDLTAEKAAETLRVLPDVHYLKQ